LGLNGGSTPEEKIKNTALASLVIAAVALPGYWAAIPLVDRVGRKPIQMVGFVCVTLIFAFMGAFYKQLEQSPTLFFFIYGLSFFFSNFGPNTTTYIVPGEAFPSSTSLKLAPSSFIPALKSLPIFQTFERLVMVFQQLWVSLELL
jgi:MFS transporter, PHS family, inorganic phosphate transporter